MITAWYYGYHEKGAFPNQKKLCDAVRWTECSLEGQRLKSPTTLSAPIGNPITIRLLALQEALKKLQGEISSTDRTIKKLFRKSREGNKLPAMTLTFQTQDSSANGAGAPVERIEIGDNEPFEFRHFIVHLALYQFFTNLGSVLDRLAYEIDLLYRLEIEKVDWSKLVNREKGKNKHWDKLKKKDPRLTKYLKRLAPKFRKALRYRNRLVHDGIIRFEADIHILSGVKVLLLQNPDDDASPLNKNAVTFCKRTKTKVLKSLDGSYELMLEHLATHSKPPW